MCVGSCACCWLLTHTRLAEAQAGGDKVADLEEQLAAAQASAKEREAQIATLQQQVRACAGGVGCF